MHKIQLTIQTGLKLLYINLRKFICLALVKPPKACCLLVKRSRNMFLQMLLDVSKIQVGHAPKYIIGAFIINSRFCTSVGEYSQKYLAVTKSWEFLCHPISMPQYDITNFHYSCKCISIIRTCILQVTELAPLRSLLECLKDRALKTCFTVPHLVLFTHQIAQGMAYLESKRFIHRDLAARNILVFAKDKVC